MSNKNGVAVQATNGSTPVESNGSEKTEAIARVRAPRELALLRMESDLHADARRIAAEGGEVEVQPDKLAKLIDHAEAMAEQLYREEFDPRGIESDRLRDEDFKRIEKDLPNLLLAERNAAHALGEQEVVVAETPEPKDPGEVSTILVIAAVTLIASSTAPALHDVMPVFIMGAARMLIALILALSFGIFITWGILSEHGRRHPWIHWLALIGGLVLSAALGLFRLVVSPDLLYPIVLFLIEAGTIVVLHACATAHRKDLEDFEVRSEVRGREQRKLNALVKQHQRRLDDLNRAIDARAAHIAYVEDRFNHRYHLDGLKQSAREAVRSGYVSQVDANLGKLLGAPAHRREVGNANK